MSGAEIGLVAIVLIALAFDYTNGFHDAANAIATAVSTRALTPRVALALAAVANLVGALLSTEIAKTVGKGILDPAQLTSNEGLAQTTAFRNGTLQGAYLMIAARAVGLDIGAMSGFDNAKVDEAFFADSGFKSNFLCNLGYGDPSGVYGRLPRFGFDEVCTLA